MIAFAPTLRSAAPVLLGRTLTTTDLEDVARRGRPAQLCPEAREKMRASRRSIDRIADGGDAAPRVYGVNTGFGFLSETRIGAADVQKLQQNLIRSHACGIGPDLSIPEVRAMMLLRAQVIALGHSGVRDVLADLLCEMLDKDVHPRIPGQGSVGASGDLAPLAHLALVLTGEGEAYYDGRVIPGGDALAMAGITPVVLAAKEGLALINGTQLMAALGVLAVEEARRLATIADIAGAISLEANKGSVRPFDARVVGVRPHPGAGTTASNLRALLRDSPLMASHVDCGRVQDAYSFRCMPQVHGATRDALGWASEVLSREINSVTDNPLVFLDEKGDADLISGGNFHGQPLALALDLAAMATAELGNISERRVEQLVNPALSSGLTPFLARDSGLHSGFMIAQVASASLVSENKVLSHPASVDSIPSSAGKEDHVSMGSVSARKLGQVVENVRRSLAIEIMTASVGVDQRAPLVPSLGVRAAVAAVREVVAPFDDDRPLYRDIEATAVLVASGKLRLACEEAVGPLGLAAYFRSPRRWALRPRPRVGPRYEFGSRLGGIDASSARRSGSSAVLSSPLEPKRSSAASSAAWISGFLVAERFTNQSSTAGKRGAIRGIEISRISSKRRRPCDRSAARGASSASVSASSSRAITSSGSDTRSSTARSASASIATAACRKPSVHDTKRAARSSRGASPIKAPTTPSRTTLRVSPASASSVSQLPRGS